MVVGWRFRGCHDPQGIRSGGVAGVSCAFFAAWRYTGRCPPRAGGSLASERSVSRCIAPPFLGTCSRATQVVNMTNPFVTERPLAVLDLETTGTSVDNDRIVEIAVLKLHPDGRKTSFVQRLNPGIPIPAEAAAVHGIRSRDVANRPRFERIAERLKAVLDDCDLAGFNLIDFDLRMLRKEFHRTGTEFDLEGRRIVDAKRIFHRKEPRDLAAAVRFFCNREHAEAHSALGDARACLDVLLAQIEYYDDLEPDLERLHDYCNEQDPRYVDSGRKFVWRDNQAAFAFGKHNSRLLREVSSESPNYLQWMLEKMEDLPTETRDIVRQALKGKYPKRAKAAEA